jgi:four helix bundle protein
MANSIVFEKSKDFAVRIVRLYKYLNEDKKEYVLSKQLLRSGTSIGANISEALCAISKKDFLSKMYIAYKECSEVLYWLELLKRTDYLNDKEYKSVVEDCKEIERMLSSITKSLRGSIRAGKSKGDKNS